MQESSDELPGTPLEEDKVQLQQMAHRVRFAVLAAQNPLGLPIDSLQLNVEQLVRSIAIRLESTGEGR